MGGKDDWHSKVMHFVEGLEVGIHRFFYILKWGGNLPTATRVSTLFLVHTKNLCNRKRHKKCSLQEAVETANRARKWVTLALLTHGSDRKHDVVKKWAKRVFLKYDILKSFLARKVPTKACKMACCPPHIPDQNQTGVKKVLYTKSVFFRYDIFKYFPRHKMPNKSWKTGMLMFQIKTKL